MDNETVLAIGTKQAAAELAARGVDAKAEDIELAYDSGAVSPEPPRARVFKAADLDRLAAALGKPASDSAKKRKA